MRTLSAAESKGRYRHHNDIPGPGTKIRALFDLFYPPLTVVSLRQMRAVIQPKHDSHMHKYLEVLLDMYGLDIRRHHSGHYWLVGEYFPKGYLDYADESYKQELGRVRHSD